MEVIPKGRVRLHQKEEHLDQYCLLAGLHVIWCNVVLKQELYEQARFAHYKAHIVAKSNVQKDGVDYDETLATFISFNSLMVNLGKHTSAD